MPQCVAIRVVSYNFGIAQGMLESPKKWNHEHIFTFRNLLEKFGDICGFDFIFGCEVGDKRAGFKKAKLNLDHVVNNALASAGSCTEGAYLQIWNTREKVATLVRSGVWSADDNYQADVHWGAYDIHYREAFQFDVRGAPQPAIKRVGLLVANMHIPCGKKPPSHVTRRKIVKDALKRVADMQVLDWNVRDEFPVMRLLVGDCNLNLRDACAVVQELPAQQVITRLQRDLDLTRWQVLSTTDKLSGDIMFCLGGFAEERTAPVGYSWDTQGMRFDTHDAVGAELMIPIGRKRRGAARPAAGGAPQPATAAASSEGATDKQEPPADGAPEAAVAAAVAEEKEEELGEEEFRPDWDEDVSEDVTKLHDTLREAEAADDTSPRVQEELGKILFKKKTVTTGGVKRQYVADKLETIRSIHKLLRRRQDYMVDHNLSDPADGRYLFTDKDRKQVMEDWKEEFHNSPDQLRQQQRDSWKPMPNERRIALNGSKYTLDEFITWYGEERGQLWFDAAAVDDAHGILIDRQRDFGPNRNAVRKGKHSRFARHLQLEAGSKTMAELIVYAGRYDAEFLNQAHEKQCHSGASQPASTVQKGLKRAAATAKLTYRETCKLYRRLNQGNVDPENLAPWQKRNLDQLMDGSLLNDTNRAVAEYGHGTLRRNDGESLEIGGSTGGLTRCLLDGKDEPDVQTFLGNQ